MLLDTSGLLCHQYAGEAPHSLALRLFESSGRKLTHSYVLAEFLALVTARRLPRGQAITFLQRLLVHPLVEIVWSPRSPISCFSILSKWATSMSRVAPPFLLVEHCTTEFIFCQSLRYVDFEY